MIYLFFGEKHFRNRQINSWKNAFKDKFTELNIFHVKNYLDHDFNFYNQNFLSNSFFSEKIFFIIDDFPITTGEKDDDIIKYQEFFLNILGKISQENIIIFNNETVDKRSKIFKKIQEIGEIRDFSINDLGELKEKLTQIYDGKVSIQAINKIIELKGEKFGTIKSEFDKILITKDFIDVKDLSLVSKEIDENIFEIINDILGENTKQAILKLRDLGKSLDNPFLLYNSLLSNLRAYFYIFYLKKNGIENKVIIERLNLGNRGFLVGKNYKIKFNDFIKMYEKFSKIDEKIKTGELIGNNDEDLMYEIEKVLLIGNK